MAWRPLVGVLVEGRRHPEPYLDHEYWPSDLSILDETVFDHARIHGPRQLTDVYLLGLAARHGGRLVTFDQTIALAAVPTAKPDNLVVL